MRKIILIIVILFLVSGCLNYRESDTIAFVSTLAIDYQNNNFSLILEIEELESKTENTAIIINTEGPTIKEAIDKLLLTFDKNLYFGILDILLITPNAFTKINEITNYIKNDYDFAFNFNIAIANDPSEIITLINDQDHIFGNYVRNILKNKNNDYLDITYPEFLRDYLASETLTLPKIEINGQELSFGRTQ